MTAATRPVVGSRAQPFQRGDLLVLRQIGIHYRRGPRVEERAVLGPGSGHHAALGIDHAAQRVDHGHRALGRPPGELYLFASVIVHNF